jgi:hypothetical protein
MCQPLVGGECAPCDPAPLWCCWKLAAELVDISDDVDELKSRGRI